MKPVHRNRRIGFIAVGAILLSGAAFLVFSALEQNVAYFYTPSKALAANIEPEKRIRLGGMVETGSIKIDGATMQFYVTDGAARILVSYTGIRPDLFREGQGAIAQGHLNDNGDFNADTILAKHDENYVPKELIGVVEEAEAGI